MSTVCAERQKSIDVPDKHLCFLIKTLTRRRIWPSVSAEAYGDWSLPPTPPPQESYTFFGTYMLKFPDFYLFEI